MSDIKVTLILEVKVVLFYEILFYFIVPPKIDTKVWLKWAHDTDNQKYNVRANKIFLFNENNLIHLQLNQSRLKYSTPTLFPKI